MFLPSVKTNTLDLFAKILYYSRKSIHITHIALSFPAKFTAFKLVLLLSMTRFMYPPSIFNWYDQNSISQFGRVSNLDHIWTCPGPESNHRKCPVNQRVVLFIFYNLTSFLLKKKKRHLKLPCVALLASVVGYLVVESLTFEGCAWWFLKPLVSFQNQSHFGSRLHRLIWDDCVMLIRSLRLWGLCLLYLLLELLQVTVTHQRTTMIQRNHLSHVRLVQQLELALMIIIFVFIFLRYRFAISWWYTRSPIHVHRRYYLPFPSVFQRWLVL